MCSVLALVPVAGASSSTVPVDAYGGGARAVAPATGHFQVKQVGDRWMFVTPEGNGLWMTAIFGVISPDWVDDSGTSMKDRIAAKYGGGEDWVLRHWRVHTAQRLKGWGFNTLSAYHHWGMRPGPRADPNPEAMPYIHIINPARYVLKHDPPLGSGPVKDLVFGTDTRYHDGWRGSRMLDFFDPNFESYVDGWMRGDPGLGNGDIGNPWMVGIAMDEGDSLFGFGPGLEAPAPRLHTHPGLVALITHYEQACNPWVGSSTPTECDSVTPYADRKVYTKHALRDFLWSRYGGDISALNAAWGASYTSFDSEGGWGLGSGLLDENGRNTWVGKWYDEMASASPAFRADLDDFLYLYAQRYFTVMAGKIRQYAPGHLVFGPTSLNNWGGLTRGPILRAAGESVDVLQATINSQRVLELTASYAGNKPIVTWDSFTANPDSALFDYLDTVVDFGGHTRLAPDQRERGQLFADKLDFLFNGVTPAGVHPVAGMTLWAWSDHWGEKANFGVVSFLENAYDGREAVMAQGVDPWGWPTGGEAGDYGDFLSAVTASHGRVRDWMKAIAFRPLPARALALFDPDMGAVTLVDSSDALPPESAFTTYSLTAPVNGQWVLGDWDGDGIETPAVYGDNGAFFYTNDAGPTTSWTGIWFGLLGRPPVAGRFEATAAHDCLGVVDSAPWPGYGTAFALYFTCDLTSGENPPKRAQWVGPILPDSGGFSGVHQFATGDFDGDGVESLAVRRGPYIAWTNVPPTMLMSKFTLAQHIGAPAAGEGQLVAGDWDADGLDSFGLFYPDGSFYRRNDLEWNSDLYTLQRIGQPIGPGVTVTSWRPGS